MKKTVLNREYRKPVLSAEFQVLSVGRKTWRPAFSTPNTALSTRYSALGTQHSKGFSLLELIVVICIISVLIGSILNRVSYYQEQAEKSVVEQMAGAMQSALIMRYGKLMASGTGTEKGLLTLATDNPMNWLQQKPNNYAGEFFIPSSRTVTPGQWMFDLKSHELIYVMDRSDYFTPGKDGQKWIRFHVRLEFEAPIGAAAGSKKELASTLFEPTEPYRWFD